MLVELRFLEPENGTRRRMTDALIIATGLLNWGTATGRPLRELPIALQVPGNFGGGSRTVPCGGELREQHSAAICLYCANETERGGQRELGRFFVPGSTIRIARMLIVMLSKKL